MSTHPLPETLPVVVHIDDDDDLLELTRLALQPLAVHFVPVVRAQAGLETVRFAHPALVLLDLMMPDLDGWEFLRHIRAEPELKNTRIVLYTALSGKRDVERGQAAGVDEYLTKPCQPARLRSLVARLTGVADVTAASRPAAAPPPPAARPAAAEPPARPLPATDVSGMPAGVVAFVDRYLENTIALELLTYLHDNPELYVTLATLALALGRQEAELEYSLSTLVSHGLLQTYPDDRGEPAYMLNNQGPARHELDAFFKACEDPQIRIKALYRVIRRRTAWQ